VDDTFTTPGMPPGASYSPKKSWNAAPGAVDGPWEMTLPPAPMRRCSLPAEATITVPLLRA
jgi:hypothetical protein